MAVELPVPASLSIRRSAIGKYNCRVDAYCTLFFCFGFLVFFENGLMINAAYCCFAIFSFDSPVVFGIEVSYCIKHPSDIFFYDSLLSFYYLPC